MKILKKQLKSFSANKEETVIYLEYENIAKANDMKKELVEVFDFTRFVTGATTSENSGKMSK